MVWQDIVLTIVSITFSVSLIPQVYHGFKEKTGPIKLLTSTPTFVALYITALTYITLSLYFSAATTFITGTMWLLLFIQRLIYKHRRV